jgi:catechol 2,3-dioxygenase-like lactoylglutathione lyase family enzyme
MDSHRPGVTDFVHIGLVVEDLDETVRFLALLGFDCDAPGVFSGEWILCYVRGPEGLIVELAERLDGAPG